MAFNLTAQLSVALNTASLKNAANTINSQLKDVGAVSLGIPKNDADNLRYIKVQAAEASTAMEQFGRQSGLAAKRFVAFTLTAGAIITFTSSLKQALTAAVDFDREMVRLTQVSTDSVGQVGAVGNEVTRLSKNYGVSSKDLLTTAVTLKQANLSLADTKVALEALAQAALAPSFDNLRDTTEGAIAVMNQFGISAKDLGNALGAINAVAAEFAVEAQDLIEGVRKANN
jgi:Phage-related minor tail protein